MNNPMMVLYYFFLFAALVCFLLDGFVVTISTKINLQSMGLFLLVLAMLFRGILP